VAAEAGPEGEGSVLLRLSSADLVIRVLVEGRNDAKVRRCFEHIVAAVRTSA